MAMSEREQTLISTIVARYGAQIDLNNEPAVLLEILRIFGNDVERASATPDEYVQVETGAVGGVGQASRKASAQAGMASENATIAGEITNTELMREVLRLRKDLSLLAQKFS